MIGLIFTVFLIIALIVLICWGLPKIPQPGQWMLILGIVIVAIIMLACILTGYAHPTAFWPK